VSTSRSPVELAAFSPLVIKKVVDFRQGVVGTNACKVTEIGVPGIGQIYIETVSQCSDVVDEKFKPPNPHVFACY
jgi:hypothetical protein